MGFHGMEERNEMKQKNGKSRVVSATTLLPPVLDRKIRQLGRLSGRSRSSELCKAAEAWVRQHEDSQPQVP